MASTATAKPKASLRPETDVEQPVPWNVVLIDDDEHSYEYVIRMMQELFGHPLEKGFKIAQAVDKDGRAVCLTTHKEHAELKCEQILAFGRDPLMRVSKGSMTAIIEPAEFGGEDDEAGTGGDGAAGGGA
jgi:ATP-dependent Clp protease adaptor protein ClpS